MFKQMLKYIFRMYKKYICSAKVVSHCSKGVDKSRLKLCLADQDAKVNLFRVSKVSHHLAVIIGSAKLWEAAQGLDVFLQRNGQKLIHISIIIVIIPDAIKALDVALDSPAEEPGINRLVVTQVVVGQFADGLKLVV